MGFGPMNIIPKATNDTTAPGVPAGDWQQVSNTKAAWQATGPSVDADNSPLTVLTFVQAIFAQMTAEEAEVFRNDPEGLLAVPGIQIQEVDITEGQTVNGEFNIAALAIGRDHALFLRCADHPRV